MTEKYTKGPWVCSARPNGPFWHISSDYSVGGKECINGRQAVASVHAESKRGATAYAEMFHANARLIAAAPELLDALVDAVRYAKGGDVMSGAALDRARTAIAKATGGV